MSLFSPNGGTYKPPPTPYAGMINGAPAVSGPHVLVSGPTGVGKLLRLSERIPTPDGYVTMHDIKVGDQVFGRDGRVYPVTDVWEINPHPDLFRLELSDGQRIVCDVNHQWVASTWWDRAGVRTPKHRRAIATWDAAHHLIRDLNELADNVDPGELALPDLPAFLDDRLPGWRDFFRSEFGLRTALDQTGAAYELRRRQYTRVYRNIEKPPHQVLFGRPSRFYEIALALRALALRLSQRYEIRPTTDAVEQVVTVGEMLAAGIKSGDHTNWAIHVTQPLGLPEAHLPVDPYVLGAWLGDGHLHRPDFTQDDAALDEHENTDMAYLRENLQSAGYEPSEVYGVKTIHVSNRTLKADLAAAGVLEHKHIPIAYLRASYDQRLALLQGLMDTDGTVSVTGTCSLGFSDLRLAEDATALIRSLGVKATVTWGKRKHYTKGGERVTGKPHHTIQFTTTVPVFRLPRKLARLPEEVRETQQWLYVTDIQPIDPGHPDYEAGRCIAVASPDATFLTGAGYVPTHNSRRVLGPGILLWEGPVVAVSSKPDLVDLCLEQRLKWGGYNRTFLLDLSGEVPDDVVPDGVIRVVVDPAVMAQTDDDALDLATILMQSGAAGAGGGNNSGGGDSFWESVSTAPLAAILRAAPDMAWARAAVSRVPVDDGEATEASAKLDPFALENASWDAAIDILQESGSELAGGLEHAAQITGTVGEFVQENSEQFSPILASELQSASLLDSKMRDSIAVTMKSAVSPWLRSTVRGRAKEAAFLPDMLSHPASTLFIIAPATGVAAGAAVSCVDMISKRWRSNQTEKVKLPRLLLVVDELCNTMPWPKLPTVVTESRAMGIHLLVAVQATSQLAKRYGQQGMEELRQVFPCTLLLAGAPERQMLENAAWWYGEMERDRRSIDHQGHETRSTEMVPVKTAASLLPRSKNEGRLLRGSAPGADPDVLNEAGLLVQLLDISQLRFEDGS